MTEIRQAPRELLALACAARPDWDRDSAWDALMACHAAGWPWKRACEEMIRLLFADGSSPDELRHAAGSTRSARHAPGLTREERDELRQVALAACEEATERFAARRASLTPGHPAGEHITSEGVS